MSTAPHPRASPGLVSLALLGALAATLAPIAASAQSQPPAGRFEVGAMIGRRAGGLLRVPGVELPLDVRDAGDWTVGVGWRVHPRFTLGLTLSRQETRLRDRDAGIDVAEIVLEAQQIEAWFETETGGFRPEIGVSVGRTRFGLADGSAADFHPAAGIGVGGRLEIVPALDLVSRGRLIATLVRGSDRILCGDGDAPCLRTTNDTVLLQLQIAAGLAFRF